MNFLMIGVISLRVVVLIDCEHVDDCPSLSEDLVEAPMAREYNLGLLFSSLLLLLLIPVESCSSAGNGRPCCQREEIESRGTEVDSDSRPLI